VASPTRTVSYGYTGARLTTVTDVLGKTWHLGYDGAQLLTTVTDPLGHDRLVVGYDATTHRVASLSAQGSSRHVQDTFAWNAALQQATRTARTSVDGQLTDADYVDTYKSNVLVRQQLPLGSTMRYSYDDRVNLTEVQDPHGWVQVMAYSAANDLVSQSTPITSASAAVVRLVYDKSHHVLSQTDPDGNTTVYVYNGPNLGGITPPGPGSLATRLYFDNQGLLTSETNALGRQVFSYDPFGNRTVVIEQTLPGTPLNGAGSLSTYDEAGHQLTYVDARGTTRKNPNAFKSTWTYDAAGNLLSTTTPSGSTSSTYDDAGDLRSTTDARHQTTTYSWNESALQRTVSGPTGDLVQTFDPSGNLLTEQPAGGGTTEHRYDALGRETTTTTPAGLTTHYTFDSLGNVTGIEDTAGTSVQRQFDSRGLLVRSVTNGAATSTTYDPVGNITSYRDAGGALTTRTYDAHNNVASVTDAAGTTTYVYDRADNVVSRRDGNGHVTTYTYDGMSRQTSSTTANHTTTFGYDEVGNVVRTTDPDGRTTYLTLDAANRTVQSDATWAGHPTVTVKQTYDALGRRTSMTDGTGTHTYGYDAAGNLTSANGFSYDYSQPGAIAETYPDGTKVDYTVDDAGHLMTVTSGTPGTSGYVHAAYLRDAARNTTGVAFSNGVLDSRHTDASGNVTSDSLQRAGVALASDAYTYDAAGNRLSQVHTAAGSTVTNTYGYDAANRLTGFSTTSVVAALPPLATSLPVSSSSGVVGGALAPPLSTPDVTPTGSLPPADPAYGYDHVGNRTTWTTPAGTHTASYDASDQLIAETGTGGTATRSYDASGDLTKVVTSTSTRTYSYDAARRLIGVVTTGASPGSVSYTYDGDGNRVTKTAGSSTTKYVWDPFGSLPQLVLETTSAGAPIHRYVYGDGPVAMQTPSATFFFHLDPVGSVTELSDAAGNVVAGYSYDGFGRVTTSGAGAPDNPLLFQGQYLDSDTGLYDMRARNYDPDTGQFTQREPVATPTGRPLVSPYAFVANRPTVSTDPTGQTPTTASVFLGKSTTEANAAQDTRYGTTAATVGVKVTSKLGGYAAAAEAAGMEGAVATSASKVGTGLKFAGVALAVIGIGLQTFVTVESCLHDSVQACVGNVVGTAVSIGFFVGCTALTAGAGAVACALVGGLLSAGLQYVITEFGPQIVQGLVDFGNLTATAFTAGAEIVGQGLVTAGTFLAEQGQVAIGALVSGISTAVAAISSGFQAGMQTLVDAGYTAAQIATVLANTFAQGAQQAISGLVDLGYSIADAANVLKDVFSKTGAQAAQLLKDGFDYTAAQIGGILNTVYGLGDQAAAQILKNVDFAVAEVAAALVSVYHYAAALAATAVATVLDGIGYGVQQIGAALSDVLHQTDVAVATLLKGLDYTVQQIAAVLQDVFADLDQAAATALKGALFVAGEIAAGLRDVYDAVAQRAAELLKTVGFLVNDVATALNSAFTTAAQATAELLKNVGFLVTEIAGALKDVFLQAADAAATALRAIGYFAADVAAGLADAFDKTQQEVAQLLKDVGFVVGEVATALKDFYGLVAKDAAKVLEAIAFTANQVGAALQGVFTQTAAAAATLLKDAGFLVAEVAGALQSVFGTVAADAATFLKAAGFAFSEIGAVLSSVFNQAADAAAALLKGIGATAAQIGAVLTSVFNQATDAIAGLLSSIGFSNTAIQAIGGAFTDFGNDVADFFSSLF
jgi:RHS repeat-associated protein